mgnify:FL=1
MMIKLKGITPIDLYMYSLAMTLEQPFSPEDLLVKIQIEHPEWKIDFIRYRCKKYKKQKMLKRTGYFCNKRYFCLLSQTDIENAIYVVMGRSIEKRTVPEMKSSTAEENDKFITK